MKHYITTVEAVALIGLIDKIKSGVEKSPTVAAIYDLSAHELERLNNLLKRLTK